MTVFETLMITIAFGSLVVANNHLTKKNNPPLS
ncbi:putative holin-like toxin [Neobacillus sp. PS3-40]|nr:putative holin-like toxin [Neobacillus sp. PS3-40]WML44430.1 putative holin-like toxin [Neobacillus sp. PS3-40]